MCTKISQQRVLNKKVGEIQDSKMPNNAHEGKSQL